MTDGAEHKHGEYPRLHFLEARAAQHLLSQLRGVDAVKVRLVGKDDRAGREVVAFLEASGYAVEFQHLGGMVPPPLKRFVFQYQGRDATVTIAPDVAG